MPPLNKHLGARRRDPCVRNIKKMENIANLTEKIVLCLTETIESSTM